MDSADMYDYIQTKRDKQGYEGSSHTGDPVHLVNFRIGYIKTEDGWKMI